MSVIVCRPKSLPLGKLPAAERRAIQINADNAFESRTVERTPPGRRGGPRRIAVVVARKWPKRGVRLSVSFLDKPTRALRRRILEHMNAWGTAANVVFTETGGTGEVRIARFDSPAEMAGYWSYLGTEILDAEEDEPTLNLEGFTSRVSEAEFRRVVRHEAGHTLGFDHEHMRSDIVSRIDPRKAYAYFDRTEGWTREEVDEQVLTPLSKRSIMGTRESDPLSIMCYQLPGSIMKNGKPVIGGADLNANDLAFAASLYPKRAGHPPRAPGESADELAGAGAVGALPPGVAPSVAPHASYVDTFDLLVMADFQPEDGARTRRPAFAQVVASHGGARVMSTLRLRAERGERTHFPHIIGVHERIKAYTSRESGSLPNDREMLAFGGKLFDTLFQGDVRRLYDEARTRRQRHLDLVFTSMIPWIAEKPWEFAYDPGRQSFLATEEIHFVRNVLTSVPADPVVPPEGPLRILVASAQPVGFGRLSIDQEVRVIRRGFEPLVDAGLVQVDAVARVTPSTLHGYLQTGTYQVVHFIGHGVYDEARGEGCLVFVNEEGQEYPLGERAVREIFCKRGLSLVFLNACETGRGGRADFNKGVAQSLVAKGLPALVANQYSVLDSSATSFAQHFYWSVAQGAALGRAAREARIAVNYSLHGEPIDWAVPVLYARDANMTLCEPRGAALRRPATAQRESARRATARHDMRIAVWDMDSAFPTLERTLEAMNRAQTAFGFELTDLSVPLDVWDVESGDQSEDGTPYLWAERLARRLQGRPMELGVKALACITRHWMRSDDWLNIYGWWPDGGEPPIMIFSVAGFDELPAEGPLTDLALANATVTGLAGFLGDLGTHARDPQSCPLAFNESRDFEYLVNAQRFDARCRAKLERALGKKVDALDSLLALFADAEQE